MRRGVPLIWHCGMFAAAHSVVRTGWPEHLWQPTRRAGHVGRQVAGAGAAEGGKDSSLDGSWRHSLCDQRRRLSANSSEAGDVRFRAWLEESGMA